MLLIKFFGNKNYGSKDEWQIDIDLSCIERYITDLAKTEPKLRKKLLEVRKTWK